MKSENNDINMKKNFFYKVHIKNTENNILRLVRISGKKGYIAMLEK